MPSRTTSGSRRLHPLPALAVLLVLATLAVPAGAAPRRERYRNPLLPRIPATVEPGAGVVESCADPSIIYAEGYWYAYCTRDPLNDDDVDGSGRYIFRDIPVVRSANLIDWEYVGEALPVFPSWAAPTTSLFAPDIQYFNGRYYLYYSVTDADAATDGEQSAIGVATSATPAGPFAPVNSGPVVEPRNRATIDPFVIEESGQRYIFWGSYFGGIFARKLSADGYTSDPLSEVRITIDNRYEAPYIVKHRGYYYLFVSATNCCNGPLTGYTIFAGRSRTLLGTYEDRDGISLLDRRTGGTIVQSMNGNRWVGPGHNAVFRDFDGQWWSLYHAIDRDDPFFARDPGFTKRPLMLDAIDWIDGWPAVRGGNWASDSPQPAPAAQPGDRSRYRTEKFRDIRLGKLQPRYSDEFNAALDARWTWVRQPATSEYGVENGVLRFNTQDGDLHINQNNTPVLLRESPRGEYAVEIRLKLDMPVDKCDRNPADCRFVQSGVVIYDGDDNFIKLVDVSIFNTRQTEFAKELAPVPPDYPRYGNTVAGPPAEWTLLRIVKTRQGGEELYTAYTRRDVAGAEWVRGGTWTHRLGDDARIALVSMGGAGYTAYIDYVRTFEVKGKG